MRSALHDVANALTVVLGWLDQAKDGDAARRAEALRVIDESARRARSLARSALGGPDEALEPFESVRLLDLVAEVARELMPEARSKKRPVAAVATATDPVARPRALAQVLQNLVLNAIAFAPEGSFVRVSAAAAHGLATLDVVDEGPGVPPENRDGIFGGLTTREGGAGVGLSGSRALARTLGGDVVLVPSVKGAHFRITWPLAAARSSGDALEGRVALVVEDDPEVATLVELALSARGMTIIHAKRDLGSELAEHDPDVVLLDLSPVARDLPGAAALLVARRTVLMTGNADVQPSLFGARTVLLRKPFETKELVVAVSTALA